MAENMSESRSESEVTPAEVFVHRRRTRAGQDDPEPLDFEIEKCVEWINMVGKTMVRFHFFTSLLHFLHLKIF